MAELSSGVLVKLLEQMSINEKASETDNDRKPALLQIRSIIPLLSEGDLWPNQGFFLKVSDSSHAIYVSLPQEQDEMILCNKLQLGQYIHIEELEAAYPVPMLKGIRPIPGRHACIGTPQDLFATKNLGKFCRAFDSESMMGKTNDSDEKPKEMFRSSSASKARPSEQSSERTLNCLPRMCSVDKDSDSESTISCCFSIPGVKRRSWNGREATRSGETSHPPIVKHESLPIRRRSRSTCVSPARSAIYDSSDDNLSSKTRRKNLCPKLIPSSNKKRISVSTKNRKESLDQEVLFNIVNDKTSTETKISWDSLPSTLVNLGKEVLKQRDAALLAAVEALQEASAAETLLKHLSTYSELRLAKDNDLQPSVDKFLHLQDDLAHTGLIFQSLTNISPLRTDDADSNSPGSIKEALKLASERKKIATSWIKAALASDFASFTAPSKSSSAATEATNTVKRTSITGHGSKPKGTSIVKSQRDTAETQVGLAAEEHLPDWVKGSALCATTDLANSLQNDCKIWFLAYVEQYLDGVKSKYIPMETDSQIAGMMCQIKKVNDWLDMMTPKIGCKNNFALNDSELEDCGRVRSKIYGVLLNQVERTAIALENMDAIAQGLSTFER